MDTTEALVWGHVAAEEGSQVIGKEEEGPAITIPLEAEEVLAEEVPEVIEIVECHQGTTISEKTKSMSLVVCGCLLTPPTILTIAGMIEGTNIDTVTITLARIIEIVLDSGTTTMLGGTMETRKNHLVTLALVTREDHRGITLGGTRATTITIAGILRKTVMIGSVVVAIAAEAETGTATI